MNTKTEQVNQGDKPEYNSVYRRLEKQITVQSALNCTLEETVQGLKHDVRLAVKAIGGDDPLELKGESSDLGEECQRLATVTLDRLLYENSVLWQHYREQVDENVALKLTVDEMAALTTVQKQQLQEQNALENQHQKELSELRSNELELFRTMTAEELAARYKVVNTGMESNSHVKNLQRQIAVKDQALEYNGEITSSLQQRIHFLHQEFDRLRKHHDYLREKEEKERRERMLLNKSRAERQALERQHREDMKRRIQERIEREKKEKEARIKADRMKNLKRKLWRDRMMRVVAAAREQAVQEEAVRRAREKKEREEEKKRKKEQRRKEREEAERERLRLEKEAERKRLREQRLLTLKRQDSMRQVAAELEKERLAKEEQERLEKEKELKKKKERQEKMRNLKKTSSKGNVKRTSSKRGLKLNKSTSFSKRPSSPSSVRRTTSERPGSSLVSDRPQSARSSRSGKSNRPTSSLRDGEGDGDNTGGKGDTSARPEDTAEHPDDGDTSPREKRVKVDVDDDYDDDDDDVDDGDDGATAGEGRAAPAGLETTPPPSPSRRPKSAAAVGTGVAGSEVRPKSAGPVASPQRRKTSLKPEDPTPRPATSAANTPTTAAAGGDDDDGEADFRPKSGGGDSTSKISSAPSRELIVLGSEDQDGLCVGAKIGASGLIPSAYIEILQLLSSDAPADPSVDVAMAGDTDDAAATGLASTATTTDPENSTVGPQDDDQVSVADSDTPTLR